MFDVGEEDVPEDSHAVDIEHPELAGDDEEVESLAGRPNQPVKQVDRRELGLKLAPAGSYPCKVTYQCELAGTLLLKVLPSIRPAPKMKVMAKKGAAKIWSAKIFFITTPYVFPGRNLSR